MKKVAGVLLAVAATVALSSCEKPPPGVTVFSGTSSERLSPTCFSWEGQIDAQQCITQAAERAATGQTPRLSVSPGNVLGISVDPAIAEQGWYPTISGQRITQEALTSTYFRFSLPQGVAPSAEGYPLAVISEGEQKGVWALRMDVQL